MDKIFKDTETVFIKTYCFESGLWYLAKSLGDLLKGQGHKVFYIPKSKYRLISATYERMYEEPKNKQDFEDENILKFTTNDSIDKQLGNYIIKHNAKYIISFETMMHKSNWLNVIKARFRKKITLIDVPMPEWVDKKYINSKSYNIFDEIWCLNELSAQIFKEHNYKNISWDYVDRNLFNKENIKLNEKITFTHFASTNSDYSTKNTDIVINTFVNFIKKNLLEDKCVLKIHGQLSVQLKDKVSKCDFIINDDGFKTREQVAEIYKTSHCIVAPSSREGLGLSLYEGEACGCDIITSDFPPMNYINAGFLCKIDRKRSDFSLIPLAVINENSLIQCYLDVYKKWS